MRERSCHLFTLLGTPGIGKSRLAAEFVESHSARATVVRGHCLSYGEGITYWPLVEILRDLGEPTDVAQLLEGEPDARRIVNDVFAGIGLVEGPTRPEETSRAVRQLVEALARERPLVVVLDDLHWAEPTFLDLVEHIADLSRDAPILLLCLARPDLLDTRPGWSGGKHNATTLLLEPLSEDEAETLIANLLADTELDAHVHERISAAAEGNPLFVEQMLALLSEDGVGGNDVVVPPTIQALLAARLDRLEPDERELLECASVVGKEFWQRAVAELGADPAGLAALVRKELIRPHRSNVFSSDDAYRFRHQLIRDATYEAIPKEHRAVLHERFADWLGRQLSEFEEIVGYHLEQAHGYRAELGETAPELAERAGRLLATAGLNAAERADVPAAINLLTRAVNLLPEGEARFELLPHLGYAHFDAADLDRARAVFGEATGAGSPVVTSRATVGLLAVEVMSGVLISGPLAGIEREIARLEELGDPAGLAEAYREAAKVESHLGRTEQADALFARAVENARASGSRRIEADVLVWRLAMGCWGYLPARTGIRETTCAAERGRDRHGEGVRARRAGTLPRDAGRSRGRAGGHRGGQGSDPRVRRRLLRRRQRPGAGTARARVR